MPRGKKASDGKTTPRRKRKDERQANAPPPVEQAAELPVALAVGPDEQSHKRRRNGRTPVATAAAAENVAWEAATADPEAAAIIAASEAAANPAVEQNEELAEAEADLTRRYPDRRIKPGSLRHAGAVPGFGTKRTVVIVCDCGADRTLATSDLFHVQNCVTCSRAAKKRGAKGRNGNPTP